MLKRLLALFITFPIIVIAPKVVAQTTLPGCSAGVSVALKNAAPVDIGSIVPPNTQINDMHSLIIFPFRSVSNVKINTDQYSNISEQSVLRLVATNVAQAVGGFPRDLNNSLCNAHQVQVIPVTIDGSEVKYIKVIVVHV